MQPDAKQPAELARVLSQTAAQEIDCDAVLGLVVMYLEAHQSDAALSPELAAVAQHLQVCPECHEQFEALVRSTQAE